MREHPKNRFADKISQGSELLTPSDRKIADYLLRVYPLGLLQNAAEIAEELNITASTVTRFFPKIGYDNIKEARTDFREDIRFLINSPADRVRSDHKSHLDNDIFGWTVEQDIVNMQDTVRAVSKPTADEFVELMSDTKRKVFVLGTRKEAALAHYFFYQVASFHSDIHWLEPSNLVDQLVQLERDDVLVVFDFRRYSSYHLKACEYAQNQNAKVVVFGDSPIVPTNQFADCLFQVSTTGLSAFDSYTAAITLMNSLMSMLVEKNADRVEEKYRRLESLYEHFETFTYQSRAMKDKS